MASFSEEEVTTPTEPYWDDRSLTSSLNEWQISKLKETKSQYGTQCLLKMWLNSSDVEESEGAFCNSTWDNVHCWPRTPAGTVLTKLCSEILQEAHPTRSANFEGYAKKVCLSNGSWEQQNDSEYNECAESYEAYLNTSDEDNILIPMVQHMLFFGSILSLVCLILSLAIFCNYRCLWCDRVAVHVHLMLSLVLRFLLMLVIAEPFVLERANNYRSVEVLCKSILVVFLYSTFASVSWMFVQGLHLNVTLMSAWMNVNSNYLFAIYCIIGWVVPVVFVTVYVIAMASNEQEKCWRGYPDMDEIWILLAPIMIEVVINGIFLLNVLRILLRKIRNSNSRLDSSKIKAAAKATAILFPVLGINTLLLLYNPGGEYHKYFVTLNTFFGSTQGILVSIVYCFIDKEVIAALKRSLDRMSARRAWDQTNNNIRSHRQGNPAELEMWQMYTRRQNDDFDNLCLDQPV